MSGKALRVNPWRNKMKPSNVRNNSRIRRRAPVLTVAQRSDFKDFQLGVEAKLTYLENRAKHKQGALPLAKKSKSTRIDYNSPFDYTFKRNQGTILRNPNKIRALMEKESEER